MKSLLVALFRLVVRIFFRRIELDRVDAVPGSGPVMFVVNHPSGLVDPLLIACYAPRPASFLAKSTLFGMPVLGWLCRLFDALPVYRRSDDSDTSRNRETFARAREILGRGAAIVIFPEGTSHSDPALKPIKTGAARLALGASATPDDQACPRIQIVPCGLYYTDKGSFRSQALLAFGDPIEVVPVAVDGAGEPPPEPVRTLTERIAAALGEVTLQAEAAEALDLARRAERIYSAEVRGDEATLTRQLEVRRRFVAGHAAARREAPERLAALEARIVRFERLLAVAGLVAEDLRRGGFSPGRALHYTARMILYGLVVVPAALTGTLVNYPAYRITGAVARRLARRDDDMMATLKLLGSTLFFPLTWIVLALAAWIAIGPELALAALLVAPLSAYAALRFFERLEDVGARARALLLFLRRRRTWDRLIAEREAIRAEIVALGRDLDPDLVEGA